MIPTSAVPSATSSTTTTGVSKSTPATTTTTTRRPRAEWLSALRSLRTKESNLERDLQSLLMNKLAFAQDETAAGATAGSTLAPGEHHPETTTSKSKKNSSSLVLLFHEQALVDLKLSAESRQEERTF